MNNGDTNRNDPSFNEFEEFFDAALCGFIITDNEGIVVRTNRKVAKWLNINSESVIGTKVTNMLTVGSKIFFETHLWPMLRMQGHFDEIAVELKDTGSGKFPALMNGYLGKEKDGKTKFIHFTLFQASDRRLYEENIQLAKRVAETTLKNERRDAILREQFIAVLGHDLRNPLSAISSVAQILKMSSLETAEKRLIEIVESSALRMTEMIENIMDFAHGRLGEGIQVTLINFDLKTLLFNISEELRVAWPDREIILEVKSNIESNHKGDPARIAQLVSNLLANAITHGAVDQPVRIEAVLEKTYWQITVINSGTPISKDYLPFIFHPFQREKSRSSQNGLGLGLYIASEIAKAHNGELIVDSDKDRTCFVFRVGTPVVY